jgi:drug/metabolite transporter (DMT)-like permease
MIAGGAGLAAAAVLGGGVRPLTPPEMLAITYMALAPTAISMGLWYKALEYVDSSVLGPSQYVAPLVSVALGWVLLGEPLGPAFIAGGVLTVIGVHLATRPARDDADSPPCANHGTNTHG